MSQKESPILSQLCTLLVDDQYGELSSRVFSLLARHGRQTLASLARSSHLTGKQIKNGLVVLIQQHLIFHSTEPPHNVTYYEVDWQQAYGLVRLGKMMKFVEDRFGEKAGSIVSNLVSLGHTRVGDLTEAYFAAGKKSKKEIGPLTNQEGSSNGSSEDPLPNGASHTNGEISQTFNGDSGRATTNGHITSNGIDNPDGSHIATKGDAQIESPGQLHAILLKLLQAGWLIPVDERHFLCEGDRHVEAESIVVAERFERKWPKGPKATALFAQYVSAHKRKFRDEALEIQSHRKISGTKRPATGEFERSNKRTKINEINGINGVNGVNGHHSDLTASDDDVLLEDDLVIRVNQEKLTVALRTGQLVRLSERRFCSTTSKVYQTLLLAMEDRQPRCYEPFPDPTPADEEGNVVEPDELITSRDVAIRIDRNLDLIEGLDPSVVPPLVNSHHTVDNERYINPPINCSELSLDERTRLVDKHLHLLGRDPAFFFLSWYSNRGISQWRIEYEQLARTMIQHEIENTVMSRRGRIGVRLIRCLAKQGKLDERQICLTTFTSAAMLRPVITEMQQNGFIQTQEIPRMENRLTKNSMHLIYYDRQRTRERLLHDTYKGMTRILQRIKAEKEKVQTVIDKAERTDVIGHEEEYLTRIERQALKEWQQAEEKLLIQLSRQDDLVATLRDYMGPL